MSEPSVPIDPNFYESFFSKVASYNPAYFVKKETNDQSNSLIAYVLTLSDIIKDDVNPIQTIAIPKDVCKKTIWGIINDNASLKGVVKRVIPISKCSYKLLCTQEIPNDSMAYTCSKGCVQVIRAPKYGSVSFKFNFPATWSSKDVRSFASYFGEVDTMRRYIGTTTKKSTTALVWYTRVYEELFVYLFTPKRFKDTFVTKFSPTKSTYKTQCPK